MNVTNRLNNLIDFATLQDSIDLNGFTAPDNRDFRRLRNELASKESMLKCFVLSIWLESQPDNEIIGQTLADLSDEFEADTNHFAHVGQLVISLQILGFDVVTGDDGGKVAGRIE